MFFFSDLKNFFSLKPKYIEPVFEYKPTPEPVPDEVLNKKCKECRITLSVPGSYYCDVCSAMNSAVQTPFFQLAHQEWEHENDHRRGMLG